jgi:hypothetical protein
VAVQKAWMYLEPIFRCVCVGGGGGGGWGEIHPIGQKNTPGGCWVIVSHVAKTRQLVALHSSGNAQGLAVGVGAFCWLHSSGWDGGLVRTWMPGVHMCEKVIGPAGPGFCSAWKVGDRTHGYGWAVTQGTGCNCVAYQI